MGGILIVANINSNMGVILSNSLFRPRALFLATRPEARTLNPIMHSEPYINCFNVRVCVEV